VSIGISLTTGVLLMLKACKHLHGFNDVSLAVAAAVCAVRWAGGRQLRALRQSYSVAEVV